MKKLIVLAAASIASCSQPPPSFEDMIIFYVKNSHSFDDLRFHFCNVAAEESISAYFLSDDYNEYKKSSPRIETLDDLLHDLNARAVYYKETVHGECTFSVEIYREQFANNGIAFYYSYNLPNPIKYDENRHSLESISKNNDNVHFDMRLSYDKDGKVWYFTYTSS